MADWTVLTSDDLGADRIFTSPTAQALYDNAIAIAEGAAGAPQIQTAAIADLAVTTAKINDLAVTTGKIEDEAVTPAKLAGGGIGQGGLHTNTGSGSSAGAPTLPGGQYGFYPRTAAGGETMINDGSGGLNPRVYFTAGTGQWAQRYVTTSPPFDLGDGEVHGFMFLLMRAGNPVGTWAANVPPWAYNGPTCIRADVIDEEGRKWRRVPKARPLHAAFRRGELTLPQYRERLASPECCGHDLVQIDQARKQADMPLIPHPFDAQPGDAVVLLDPMDELVAALLEAQEEGEDVIGMLAEGRLIRPDNDPLPRKGPPGVLQCRIRG